MVSTSITVVQIKGASTSIAVPVASFTLIPVASTFIPAIQARRIEFRGLPRIRFLGPLMVTRPERKSIGVRAAIRVEVPSTCEAF